MIYSFKESEMMDLEQALKVAIDSWKIHAETHKGCLTKSELEMWARWADLLEVCESIDN